jgi:DNA-binding CsgD family transcriptional regulator
MHHIGTTSPVHRRLDDEWQRLRRRPDALAHAGRWRIVNGRLHDLEQIIELTLPTRPDHEREPVLHALVERAADDELAARIVLQRLVPDLVVLHRRRRWRGGDRVDFGDLLATGWTVIRTYNPARRPARLAGSLVSDVDYREYRAQHRRMGHGQPREPQRFDHIVDEPSPDPTIELAALFTDPTARLSDADRDLVRRIMTGRTAIDIASELEITPRTLRNRRDRIAGKLRDVAVAA